MMCVFRVGAPVLHPLVRDNTSGAIVSPVSDIKGSDRQVREDTDWIPCDEYHGRLTQTAGAGPGTDV